MGLKIDKGCVVRLEYELKIKGGDVLESSATSGPMRYVHGEGKMLPALEKRLGGMSVAEEKKGVIAAAEAFPEEGLPAIDMLRREFPDGEKLELGRLFEAKGKNGQPIALKIVKLDGDQVQARLLHPLSGKDVEFRVKVLGIEDPKSGMREGVAPPPPPADALGLKEES
jgi:FKBP-type peptidyl-prolyl cis-trans isomerase SlyD